MSDGHAEGDEVQVLREDPLTRAEAIEHGRLLGEDTVRILGEEPRAAKQRVSRAMAYAAWEHDGKPDDFKPYRKEFRIGGAEVLLSGLRPAPKP